MLPETNGKKDWRRYLLIPVPIIIALISMTYFSAISLVVPFVVVAIKILALLPIPIGALADAKVSSIPGILTFSITVASVWGIRIILKVDILMFIQRLLSVLLP